MLTLIFRKCVQERVLKEQLIERIVEKSGAKHLEFELWNDKDRSKIIFEEAGYDMTSGTWEYDC